MLIYMRPHADSVTSLFLMLQVLRVCIRLLLLQGMPGATLEGRAQERLQEINTGTD